MMDVFIVTHLIKTFNQAMILPTADLCLLDPESDPNPLPEANVYAATG